MGQMVYLKRKRINSYLRSTKQLHTKKSKYKYKKEEQKQQTNDRSHTVEQ